MPERLVHESVGIIPRSPDNPEFLRVDDSEIVRDLVAPLAPVRGCPLAEEGQHRITEIPEGRVTFVVSEVSVHQSP